MMGYIYVTSNDINDILYVGKRQKPKFDKGYRGSGTRLKLAMSKYGKDHFHSAILETCESRKALNEAERKWIKLYKERGVELYNISSGGDGGNVIDWAASPELKQRMREKNRDTHLRMHGKAYAPGYVSKHASRYYDAETIKQHQKERKRRHLKPIAQLDKVTGEVLKVWADWGEACEVLLKEEHGRLAYTHIADCCKGIRKSAYGFKWKYADEERL